ncbi:MAG: bifunctional phosphoglucose/phosphomannose isomerase [Bacteroidota bacterium]
MKDLIAKFSKQLIEAVAIGEGAQLTPSNVPIKNVMITGLGGSGIGGTIVSEIAANQSPVPILVNKDYFLPKFISEESLVIVSSYSGNTEETVNAMEIAMNCNAKIVCITSGGKILEMAKVHQIDHIVLPPGMPPRSCLGYSFTQLLFVLNHLGLIGSDFKQQLNNAISLIDLEEKNINIYAQELAKKLMNKVPIIYCTAGNEGVAIRFRQQINENSKMLCWHHVIPEMNHNELVGWTQKNEQWAVVFLRNDNDYERTQKRIEINKEVISKYCNNITEIYSKGHSIIERTIYMIHLCDWVSWYLSDLRKVDATEVNVINYLKSTLAGN